MFVQLNIFKHVNLARHPSIHIKWRFSFRFKFICKRNSFCLSPDGVIWCQLHVPFTTFTLHTSLYRRSIKKKLSVFGKSSFGFTAAKIGRIFVKKKQWNWTISSVFQLSWTIRTEIHPCFMILLLFLFFCAPFLARFCLCFCVCVTFVCSLLTYCLCVPDFIVFFMIVIYSIIGATCNLGAF